jgi:hypothetical protein
MRDETGSFAYTRSVLWELDLGARAEVHRLGGNRGLIAILDRLKLNGGNDDVVARAQRILIRSGLTAPLILAVP